MDKELKFHFNGINGDTGDYLLDPATPESLSEIIRGVSFERDNLEELKDWRRRLRRKKKPMLGVADWIDPKDLSQTGWGVMFARDDPKAEAIKKELSPLLEHRREQAAKVNEKYYREFCGDEGYLAGDSKSDFLI